MKTLTTSQKQALDKGRLKLAYLCEITLQGASPPTLYLSDRNITIGSQRYENYLSELSGLGEKIERATSEGLNPDINLKFKNMRYKAYNFLIEIGDTYPWEGAVCTIKEVYLDDNDNPSDALTIFKGALDEPQNIDLMNFECSVSSMPTVKDEQFKQDIITKITEITWTERGNPKDKTLNDVVWNGNIFCAVGNFDGTDAYIITSPDGITWTERANPKNKTLHAIAWNGSIFCAVGNYDGTDSDSYITTSPDGITWTERSHPKNLTLYGITWGNSLFVAVGDADTDAYIITSPDGITWTERGNPKGYILYDVVWNGSIFCAVGDNDGSDAYILTSPNGIDWTERSNPTDLLYAISWNGSIFCAVGSIVNLITSPDGITWTPISNSRELLLYDVVWNGSIFCAVGSYDTIGIDIDAYIITSPDGITWTERGNPKNFSLLSITYGNSLFVAVGYADGGDAYITTSPDGGILEIAGYPNADPDDLNKVRNIIYGNNQQVRCHAIKAGASDSLTADITASSPGNSGTLVLSDASEFPLSGAFTIQVDLEQIRIASRSGDTLTLAASGARGYNGTTAAAHVKGTQVFEVLTEYIYMIANHPVKAIGDVYVDGVRQTSGYTAYTGQTGSEHANYQGKAIIAFTVKPIIQKQINVTANDTIGVSSSSLSNVKLTPNSGASNVRDGSFDTYQTFMVDMGFPSTSYGSMIKQYPYVHIWNTGGSDALIRIVCGGTSDDITIPAGVKTTVMSGIITSTDWSVVVGVNIISGTGVRICEVWKEVQYTITVNKTGTVTLSGNSSADVVIGASVNVDVEGYRDDGSGTYTGTANALIERPDHVKKHFIDVLYGFALTDIDTASFAAAGTLYASAISGGYKFAFVINEKITPSKFLAELAFQCRSNLKYEGGKWYLNYLPDTAPSAVKTISKSNLAGQYSKFTFNKTDRKDIVNDLTAKFQKNYGKLTYDESDWLGTSLTSDLASQGNYGVRPETYEFWAIRLQAMADHVLVFIKLQRKNPLLLIDFPVFWEHFDLERGDTFDISNDLYNAKKFYIEKIEKIDKGEMQVVGIEWPS